MRESPLTMVFHGFLIAVSSLFIMMMLNSSWSRALARSTLLGLLTASYMIAFGHGLPTRLNPELF